MSDHQNHIQLSTTVVDHQPLWSIVKYHGQLSTTMVDHHWPWSTINL